MDNKSYQDHIFKKAKNLGYRSRSAFKLLELDKKFNFLNKKTNLLDLGAFPGGWSQIARKKIKNGKIVALDKKNIHEIKGVNSIKGDFFDERIKKVIFDNFKEGVDVILSDMAADTTGNKSLDCIRTNQLCLEVLDFSKKLLIENGVVVTKLFMGEDFEEVKIKAKKNYRKINFFKPISSRDESRETYIHCSGLSTL